MRLLHTKFAFATLGIMLASLWVSEPALARKKKQQTDPEISERLARVYVFYSEPPFAYDPVEEVRIRLLTVWDREQKERAIREEVERLGADLVILERSFMEYDDSQLRVVGEPTPRGVIPKIQVPKRTAFVAGRAARRRADSPDRDCERVYPAGFDTIWNAVTWSIDALGWQAELVDTDSRYLVTTPVVTAPVTMECDLAEPSLLPAAVFTVYVRGYAETSAVRLDVAFVDPTTGEPTPCRSTGVYEGAFFRKVESDLDSR